MSGCKALANQSVRHRADVPRGSCRTCAGKITARSSISPAAARRHRCRDSAPTPPPRRPSCGFTETLAEEAAGAHIDVNAIAPGALNTRLLDDCSRPGRSRSARRSIERRSSSASRAARR